MSCEIRKSVWSTHKVVFQISTLERCLDQYTRELYAYYALTGTETLDLLLVKVHAYFRKVYPTGQSFPSICTWVHDLCLQMVHLILPLEQPPPTAATPSFQFVKDF